MVFLGASATATILLQGLFFGGILSLIAVGLTLIFGVSKVLNIAHGDFLFLGGATTVVLFTVFGLNPFLSIAVVVPVFAFVGVLMSYLMRKPLQARTQELATAASVLVTLGLSNLIEGIGSRAAPIYGYNYFSIPSSTIGIGSISIADVVLNGVFLIAFFVVIAISVGVTFLVYKTSLGSTMRAAMADREVALMLGIDTNRVSMVTFAIGISLAALAGTIDVLTTNLTPDTGLTLTVFALTVVVLGGLGSFYGALLGGFLIGFVTNLVELVLIDLNFQGSEWAGAVPLIILIAVLVALASGKGAIFNDILQILLFASMALCYDYFSGFTGYYNLGFGAFVALGAYVFVISTNHGMNVLASFALAGVLSALFAAGVSYPLLRLSGAYFAIATLALVVLLQIFDTNLFNFTGGTIGLPVDVANGNYQLPLFVASLGFTIVAIMVHHLIGRSRLGLALKSIREDEDVTESYGVNTFRTKQIVMVLSGLFAGFSGCLFAVYLQFIKSTNILGLGFGLFPVVASIAGGSGIFLGPVVGSFIVSGLNAVVPEIIAAINPTLIFGPLVVSGVILVVVGLFLPGGILRTRSLSRYAYMRPDRSITNYFTQGRRGIAKAR